MWAWWSWAPTVYCSRLTAYLGAADGEKRLVASGERSSQWMFSEPPNQEAREGWPKKNSDPFKRSKRYAPLQIKPLRWTPFGFSCRESRSEASRKRMREAEMFMRKVMRFMIRNLIPVRQKDRTHLTYRWLSNWLLNSVCVATDGTWTIYRSEPEESVAGAFLRKAVWAAQGNKAKVIRSTILRKTSVSSKLLLYVL